MTREQAKALAMIICDLAVAASYHWVDVQIADRENLVDKLLEIFPDGVK